MATAKKAVKKTVKKAAKKVAAKKKTVAAPKILAPDLNLARRIIAHDLVNRGNLRVGDTVRLNDYDDRTIDEPLAISDEWYDVTGEYVTFEGIQDDGLLRVEYDSATYTVPVEAIRWNTIDEASGFGFKLNEDYHAELSRVEEEGIVEVGCQEIEVSVIEALYQRIKELTGGKTKAPSRELTLAEGGVYAELIAK